MFGENLIVLNNLFWAMPEIFLTISIVGLFTYGVGYSKLGGIISQQKKITWLSILTLIITFILILQEKLMLDNAYGINEISIGGGMLGIDTLSLIIKLIVILSGIGILLLSLDHYIDEEALREYEYTQLILLATLGMLLLVSSRDLIMFYLSIELLSLSLYILASIRRIGQYSTEAGLKYFILGALSSGLLLFGCALIYTLTGLTGFSEISAYIWYGYNEGVLAGGLFIIIAILFKLAAAPFHMWAPDVYEGSPTIVTAFFAIVPKIATLGILVTILYGPLIGIFNELQPIILISAILSLLIASIAGLNQTKIKRLVAYSAIGHMGFMLIGVAPGSLYSLQATFVYIIIYIIMSFNTFTFIITTFKNGLNNYITELSGLSRTQPILAVTFGLGLLSLAGIPPLAGFFSKYLILLSAIESQLYVVSIAAVLCSVISAFYYVRIVKWIYFGGTTDYLHKNLTDVATLKRTKLSTPTLIQSLMLGSTLFITLTLMLYPNPLLIITFDSISNALI